MIVQGRLEAERWEDGEGPEREALCVIAERIHFADNAPLGAQPRPSARSSARHAHANDLALGMSAAIGFSEMVWG